MLPKKYRKKPVVIEAIQFVVTKEIPCKFGIAKDYNLSEISKFMDNMLHVPTVPNGTPEGRTYIEIPTLEGIMEANVGDYIIKGIKGEFYPCKPDIFEATYEDVSDEPESTQKTGLNFGQALDRLKQGFKVARSGWNGKGMFIVYQKGYPQGIPCNVQTAKAWGMNEGDLFKCEPYLQMRMATGSHFMYTPNTLDVLSDDWEIVD